MRLTGLATGLAADVAVLSLLSPGLPCLELNIKPLFVNENNSHLNYSLFECGLQGFFSESEYFQNGKLTKKVVSWDCSQRLMDRIAEDGRGVVGVSNGRHSPTKRHRLASLCALQGRSLHQYHHGGFCEMGKLARARSIVIAYLRPMGVIVATIGGGHSTTLMVYICLSASGGGAERV